ncbi:unnamed protein product [Ascophyllum nodosum]
MVTKHTHTQGSKGDAKGWNWVPRSLLVRATTHKCSSSYVDLTSELWLRVDQKNKGKTVCLSKWPCRPHNILVTIPHTIFPKNHKFPNYLQLLVSIVSSQGPREDQTEMIWVGYTLIFLTVVLQRIIRSMVTLRSGIFRQRRQSGAVS